MPVKKEVEGNNRLTINTSKTKTHKKGKEIEPPLRQIDEGSRAEGQTKLR